MRSEKCEYKILRRKDEKAHFPHPTSHLKNVIKFKNIYKKKEKEVKHMVKIRLQRAGKKKAPFYHIVVADSKSPRDGKIIEQIGTYDPMSEPSVLNLDSEKVEKWIKNGAKPTDTVKGLIEKA